MVEFIEREEVEIKINDMIIIIIKERKIVFKS